MAPLSTCSRSRVPRAPRGRGARREQPDVRWWRGSLTLLGDLPGGDRGDAHNINDRGMVLGGANVVPQTPEEHAFLWRAGIIRDLSPAGIPDNAGHFNNRGEIIGGCHRLRFPGRAVRPGPLTARRHVPDR